MKHYYDFKTPVCNAAVAFGRFDGMHIGHRAVVKKLASYSNSVLVSFADNYGGIIYTEIEKEYVLKNLGVENMITVKAETFDTMDTAEFVKNYLVGKLSAKTVVVGENYDKLNELKAVCKENGVSVDVVPTVMDNGKEVTTDMIKEGFQTNDMNENIRLLGGSYVMVGPVVHGKEAGRKHGMPTANQAFARNKLWPKHGVYGTLVRLGDSKWKGMTNLGLRPSDDDIPIPTSETFILNFDGQIYDTPLILEAFIYVRPVIKFPSLDEVRAQIDKDIKQIESTIDTL